VVAVKMTDDDIICVVQCMNDALAKRPPERNLDGMW